MAALGTLLAGCASNQTFATLTQGACEAFPRPTYQVMGKTHYDQEWIDVTVEAGVAGCKWMRPEARPAAFDAAPEKAKEPAKPKKKTLWDRLRFKKQAPTS